MKMALFASLALAATPFAAVPNTFSAGRSVVAREVNENFTYLDTALAKKADAFLRDSVANLRATLSSKADLVGFNNLKAKQSSDSLVLASAIRNNLTAASLSGIRDTLGKKTDTAASNAISRQVSSLNSALGNLAGKDAWNSQTISKTTNEHDFFYDSKPGDVCIRAASPSVTLRLGVYDGVNGTNQSGLWYSKDQAGSNLPFSAPTGNFGYTTIAPNLDPNSIGVVPEADGNLIGWNRIGGGRAFDFVSQQSAATNAGGFMWWLAQGTDWTRLMNLDRYGNLSVVGSLTANNKILATRIEATDLNIAGTITTTAHQPVADYVFEPDYKLTSLSEIEAYTKEHKHLPEVPSATEIGKSGLDLAQMNLVLLKKVEELTLHAIAQQKEITDLKTSVQELKSR